MSEKIIIDKVENLNVNDGDIVLIKGNFVETEVALLRQHFAMFKSKRGIDFDCLILKPDVDITVVKKDEKNEINKTKNK